MPYRAPDRWFGLRSPTKGISTPRAFTLVEILVATTLSLLLMGAVIQMFGRVSEAITNSRSMLESADRLRLAAARLQQDLAGITVTVDPPRQPEDNEGYFEYIEGPIGLPPSVMTPPSAVAQNTTDPGGPLPDTTVGDFDDILMFTTRSTGRPFVGKFGVGTIQSDVAEVAWFLRGRTLHRRVLLVVPGATLPGTTTAYSLNYDVSAHLVGGVPMPNTLGDLTRRECRFAHHTSVFPYDSRIWQWTAGGLTMPTLPTLRECAVSGWLPATSLPPVNPLDFWSNIATAQLAEDVFAGSSQRVADDVILTNVIGFDVKAWDSTAGTAGAFVDLGYNGIGYVPGLYGLNHLGNPNSGLDADASSPSRIYDTYSTSYEDVAASDGFDNDGNGIVDDDGEKVRVPPYPVPLRGVQVKIRVFEPDSRQIREVTVVQDFLPQ